MSVQTDDERLDKDGQRELYIFLHLLLKAIRAKPSYYSYCFMHCCQYYDAVGWVPGRVFGS